jgi:hypothetical protein
MDLKAEFLQAQSRYFDISSATRQRLRHTRLDLNKFLVPQPDICGVPWAIFYLHARDYTREVRNSIELFGTNILRLDAWSEVLNAYSEDMLPWMLEECVLPIAIHNSVTPFTIHERMVYCVSMLLHMSAGLSNPNASRSINERCIGKKELFQGRFRKTAAELSVDLTTFKAALEGINTTPLIEFRHRLTHRLPPNVEYGNVTTLVRAQNGEHVAFGGGGETPVKIQELVQFMWIEHEHCVRSFEQFHALVCDLVTVWHSRS